MLTQNELKYYSALLQKKYRQQEQKFIVEGKRLVEEALKSNYKCEVVIMSEFYAKKDHSTVEKFSKHLRTEIITEDNFKKIAETKAPQGIAAVVSIPSSPIKISKDEKLIVAIENISDPGNVGTIIRTCDWFGVKSVIVSPESVDVFNPKVIRSTMGSLFHINVYNSSDFYTDLVELKQKGRKILCSAMHGENIFSYRSKERAILILSNEAHGPTEEMLKLSDQTITIPKYGNAESLNVASAAAVIIAELIK